jgi:chemosensory pili system protein ChpE/L-lysine exporter family protein LysE/ArgO
MLSLFLTALALGFVFNAAPGAVFAETIRRSIGGFRPALAVQLGSLAGDALWAVLGLAGVGLLLQLDVLRLPIGFAGVSYLLWLAWDAWQEARRLAPAAPGAPAPSHTSALRSGVMLSITNPQNIAYWAALGSAMGAVGVVNPSTADYVIFFIAFMCSSLIWSFVCAGLAAAVFRRAGSAWAKLTYRVCAIVFLLLALSSLRSLWQSYSMPVPSSLPTAPVPGEGGK